MNSGELKQIGYHAIGTSAVSKVDVPIIDTPTTVNVVTSRLIEDRKPNDLNDALSSVSGVSQANTLGGIFDAVQKRGFGGNRDNSIMRNGTQAGPSHNFSATTDAIEVLKARHRRQLPVRAGAGGSRIGTCSPSWFLFHHHHLLLLRGAQGPGPGTTPTPVPTLESAATLGMLSVMLGAVAALTGRRRRTARAEEAPQAPI